MKRIMRAGFLWFLAGMLPAQESAAGISGLIEWDRMEINTQIILNLDAARLRLPSGRSQAEELMGDAYPRLIRPFILSIPVDSSSTVEDMVNRGEISLHSAGNLALTARRIPPALSADLASLSARYTVSLHRIGAEFVRHTRPLELPRVLTPVPVAAYTGIIIIANEELPIHGRNSRALPQPCIFPKIWDSEMNLIYERNTVEGRQAGAEGMVRYISRESIFRPTPSGLDEELIPLVGINPLRIIARGVFGIRPTDPIIDRADALLILSSEANRSLLRQGKVAIVLDRDALKTTIP
jgi:hypothetical protein